MSLRQFDTFATGIVARLPGWLQTPFSVLGFVTQPFIWAFVLAGLIIFEQPSGLSASMIVLLLLPLATLSKFAFRRHRPPTIYAGGMRIKSYSFPSSHSYAAMLCCGYLAALAIASNAGWLAILPISLALTVGISRVYLGAHYPSDVLAGWLLGLIAIGGILLWA